MRGSGSGAALPKRGKDKGLKRREGDDDDEEPDRQSERGSRASKKSKQSQQVGGRSFVRKCYTCGKTATETTFMSQDSTGMPVDDGCYNCGGTWSETNPGQPWSACKEKFDKEPKWRPKFQKSARIRSGEIEAPQWDSEGNVLDWETTEMEITQELGLLSENEFESLAGFSGAAIKGELQKVPSHLGMDKSFFVITLDGLPCTVTNGMRKLRCKYRFGLTRQDMLLSAARQLVEGQGKVVFSYHSEEQLKQRPKGLQTEQQFKDLKSLDQLKEKVQKALAKSGAAPAKTKDESSSEADEDDDGPKEKKLKIQQSGRLQKTPKPKRKSKGQKAGEPEVATVEGEGQVPKDLESVVEARGSTPKCFLNLHIPRILKGEKLMRSVDAAKKIMDEMKGQRQFQWKTLHKHIELCELANGMTHNASQLSARECRLAMEKLLLKNIELPFNIQLVGTEKILAGTWHDLLHSPQNTSPQDINKTVDQMMSVLISWRHCLGDEVDVAKKTKEVEIFSFDDLAADLQAEREDVDDDEEQSKMLDTLEEAGSLRHTM
ncbi:hypothetical protein AK812_SmicGene27867 [Symbiodinium microadriaticum]|uniref:Uncharacterized protein n=1 Tax=Symbiodinium microadriaticum TaxID=2951 RepID=A0A1Q9D5R0_SYMMI|nr:hypothetical protein AK812_SmicGene27867 [Symbiodinium microadriaticum]